MPLVPITLNFTKPLNVSIQVGDMVYYCNTVPSTTAVAVPPAVTVVHQSAPSTEIVKMGEVIDLLRIGPPSQIVCWIHSTTPPPTPGSFIMFSKDNKVNLSSLLGYYAEVEFRNNSKTKAELFSVGADVFESSK